VDELVLELSFLVQAMQAIQGSHRADYRSASPDILHLCQAKIWYKAKLQLNRRQPLDTLGYQPRFIDLPRLPS